MVNNLRNSAIPVEITYENGVLIIPFDTKIIHITGMLVPIMIDAKNNPSFLSMFINNQFRRL